MNKTVSSLQIVEILNSPLFIGTPSSSINREHFRNIKASRFSFSFFRSFSEKQKISFYKGQFNNFLNSAIKVSGVIFKEIRYERSRPITLQFYEVDISDCVFLECRSPDLGGGIELGKTDKLYSYATVQRCFFYHCYAEGMGGGLSVTERIANISDTCYEECGAQQGHAFLLAVELDPTIYMNRSTLYKNGKEPQNEAAVWQQQGMNTIISEINITQNACHGFACCGASTVNGNFKLYRMNAVSNLGDSGLHTRSTLGTLYHEYVNLIYNEKISDKWIGVIISSTTSTWKNLYILGSPAPYIYSSGHTSIITIDGCSFDIKRNVSNAFIGHITYLMEENVTKSTFKMPLIKAICHDFLDEARIAASFRDKITFVSVVGIIAILLIVVMYIFLKKPDGNPEELESLTKNTDLPIKRRPAVPLQPKIEA